MDGPVNIPDLQRQHRNVVKRIQYQMDAAAEALATRALNMAQNTNAITYRGPGRGRESWKKRVFKVPGGAGGQLTNNKLHMLCQESGSGLWGPKKAKYPIVARRAKALRFWSFRLGLMFRKSVMHPGVKPKWIGRSAMFGVQAPYFGENHSPNIQLISRYLDKAGDSRGGMKLAAQ
jgi:hypothetical protein